MDPEQIHSADRIPEAPTPNSSQQQAHNPFNKSLQQGPECKYHTN